MTVVNTDGLTDLQLTNVEFSYSGFELGPISLHVGLEKIGLIGPNGAGKTTLMSLIAGTLPGASGLITSHGACMPDLLRRLRFAYSGDQTVWHDSLTIRDYLRLMRKIYANWDSDLEVEWMRRFSLKYTMSPAGSSSGTKAKCSILLALCRGASLLLLDEPWSALDPVARAELTEELAGVSRDLKIGLIVSSHELDNVQGLCSRLIFLNNGRIVADGAPTDLARETRVDSDAGLLALYKGLLQK